MKRSERRHLKQNAVATWVSRAAELAEQRRRPLLAAAGLVLAALVAWGGFSAWQARSNAAASEILAEAMGIMNATVVPPLPVESTLLDGSESGETDATEDAAPSPVASPAPLPPGSYRTDRAKREAALVKFVEAAEAQPDGEIGLAARYHAATILAELGRVDEAVEHYRIVSARSSAGLYADMARLGLAELDAIRGDYDAAIATWLELSADPEAPVPTDGALMQLGEVYVQAGNEADALETFSRIVNEFPTSQYATPAQQEIDRLEGKGFAPLRP